MSALDPRSRYAGLPTVEVRQDDGSVRRFVAPRVVPAPPCGGSFVVPPGARLDLLALELLGETTRWWRLADANPWADATRLEVPGSSIALPRDNA